MRNELDDHVTLVMLFNTIAKLNGTCKWTWLCNYEATQIKKRIEQIQQTFTVTRTNDPKFPKQKNCSGTVTIQSPFFGKGYRTNIINFYIK